MKDHVGEQYKKFTRTFYSNAIWLGKGTYDLVEEFVQTSRVFLNELNCMRRGVGRLPDDTKPKDWREDQLTPKFKEVRDALQDEVEASRYLIPFPIVIKKNGAGPPGTNPGEGQ